MKRSVLAVVVALLLGTALAQSQYGRWEGDFEFKWAKNGRDMILLKEVRFIDRHTKVWTAPVGVTINGASIPQIAWSAIGGPYEGRYREASVIHDVYCDTRSEPWEAVHETFYYAMLASGVETWRAKVMYAGVYAFGPRWTVVVKVPAKVTIGPGLTKTYTPTEPGLLEQAKKNGSTISLKAKGIPSATNESGFANEYLVTPPRNALTPEKFEELKEEIERREAANPIPIETIKARIVAQGGPFR